MALRVKDHVCHFVVTRICGNKLRATPKGKTNYTLSHHYVFYNCLVVNYTKLHKKVTTKNRWLKYLMGEKPTRSRVCDSTMQPIACSEFS